MRLMRGGSTMHQWGPNDEHSYSGTSVPIKPPYCPPLVSVTVSVLSIEGTECRLDELGKLADRTGGKVRRCFHRVKREFSSGFIMFLYTCGL